MQLDKLQVSPVFTIKTKFSHFPIQDWDGFYKQTNKQTLDIIRSQTFMKPQNNAQVVSVARLFREVGGEWTVR